MCVLGVQGSGHRDEQSERGGDGRGAAPPHRRAQSAAAVQHRRLQESRPRQGQFAFCFLLPAPLLFIWTQRIRKYHEKRRKIQMRPKYLFRLKNNFFRCRDAE